MENDTLLYISNFVSVALFLISEILGMSTCEYNGVFHFAIGGCFCKKKIYVDVNIPEENVV